MENEKKSLLMRDSSEGDSQKETMIDFILSWTLRRAMQKYSDEMPILHHYCNNILCKLIGITITDDTQVLAVETWKQWKYIDLWVNIKLIRDGNEEFHAVLIENKAYTPTHHNQLARYKVIFDQVCDEYMPDANRHYILITALDKMPITLAEECKDNGYTPFCLGDLNDYEQRDSESDLFNEFWLRYW